MLVVGRFDDDLYVYDASERVFKSLDSLTLIEIERYEGFPDLFFSTVGEYSSDEDDPDEEDE